MLKFFCVFLAILLALSFSYADFMPGWDYRQEWTMNTSGHLFDGFEDGDWTDDTYFNWVYSNDDGDGVIEVNSEQVKSGSYSLELDQGPTWSDKANAYIVVDGKHSFWGYVVADNIQVRFYDGGTNKATWGIDEDTGEFSHNFDGTYDAVSGCGTLSADTWYKLELEHWANTSDTNVYLYDESNNLLCSELNIDYGSSWTNTYLMFYPNGINAKVYIDDVVYDKSIDSDVTNDHAIPFFIGADNTDFWNGVDSTGKDVRFTTDDGETELDYHFETWVDDANMLAWVEISETFSSVSDLAGYIYYGNSGASDDQNEAGTYPATYEAVFHLDDVETDSVSGNDGTWVGSEAYTTGKIGEGGTFDGSTDVIDIDSIVDATDFYDSSSENTTITGWIKSPDAGNESFGGYYCHSGHASCSAHGFFYGMNSSGNFDARIGGASGDDLTGTSSTDDDTWEFVSIYHSTNTGKIYVNAVQEDTDASSIDPNFTGGGKWSIGASWITSTPAYANFFNGEIDEVQYHASALSVDEIGLLYNSQNDPTSFISFGAEEESIVEYQLDFNIYAVQLDEHITQSVDMDCDVDAYDLNDQSSPFSQDMNSGTTYTCDFVATGYDTNIISFEADSNKTVVIYLQDSDWWDVNYNKSRIVNFNVPATVYDTNALKFAGVDATDFTSACSDLNDLRWVWQDTNVLDVNYNGWDGTNADTDFNVILHFHNNGTNFSLAGGDNNIDLKVYYDNDYCPNPSTYYTDKKMQYDGFEDNDFSSNPTWTDIVVAGWSNTGDTNPSIDSGIKKNGDYSLKIPTDNDNDNKWSGVFVPIDYATDLAGNVAASAWVRITTTNQGGNLMFTQTTNAAEDKCGMKLHKTGVFQFSSDAGNVDNAVSYSADTWYKFVMEFSGDNVDMRVENEVGTIVDLKSVTCTISNLNYLLSRAQDKGTLSSFFVDDLTFDGPFNNDSYVFGNEEVVSSVEEIEIIDVTPRSHVWLKGDYDITFWLQDTNPLAEFIDVNIYYSSSVGAKENLIVEDSNIGAPDGNISCGPSYITGVENFDDQNILDWFISSGTPEFTTGFDGGYGLTSINTLLIDKNYDMEPNIIRTGGYFKVDPDSNEGFSLVGFATGPNAPAVSIGIYYYDTSPVKVRGVFNFARVGGSITSNIDTTLSIDTWYNLIIDLNRLDGVVDGYIYDSAGELINSSLDVNSLSGTDITLQNIQDLNSIRYFTYPLYGGDTGSKFIIDDVIISYIENEDTNFFESRQCTYSIDTTGISDGNWYFDVSAVGSPGDTNSSVEFTIDNNAPVVSVDGNGLPWNSSDFNIVFDVNFDPSGDKNSTYRIDGGPLINFNTYYYVLDTNYFDSTQYVGAGDGTWDDLHIWDLNDPVADRNLLSITNQMHNDDGFDYTCVRYEIYFTDGTTETSSEECVLNQASYISKTFTITSQNKDFNRVALQAWHQSGIGFAAYVKDTNIIYSILNSGTKSDYNVEIIYDGNHTIDFNFTDNAGNSTIGTVYGLLSSNDLSVDEIIINNDENLFGAYYDVNAIITSSISVNTTTLKCFSNDLNVDTCDSNNWNCHLGEMENISGNNWYYKVSGTTKDMNGGWICDVNGTDVSGYSNSDSNTTTMEEVIGVTVDSESATYSVFSGSTGNAITTDQTNSYVEVTHNGNVNLDMTVTGDDFNYSVYGITKDNQYFNTENNYGAATSIDGTAQIMVVDVNKGEYPLSSFQNTWFWLDVPVEQYSGPYTSTTTIGGVKS